MKVSIADGASIVLSLCAVALTAVFVRREARGDGKRGPMASFRVAVLPADATTGGHASGPAGAAVTIIEFADFQCPYCAGNEPVVRAIREQYGPNVRLIYRHFPITALHPLAREAALASECAGDQGRFWQYHALLFARQDSIGVLPWAVLARRAGVPSLSGFRRCVRDQRYQSLIARDGRVAGELGVTGTPTFVIGDRIYEGTMSFTDMDAEVKRQLPRDKATRRN